MVQSISSRNVDHVGERLTAHIPPDVLSENRRDPLEELRRDPRDVRRDDDLWKLVQRVVAWERLDVEHVQPRAGDPAFPQRPDERRFLYDRSTRDVNEDG